MQKAQFHNPQLDPDMPSDHRHYHQRFDYDALSRLTGADYGFGVDSSSAWFDVGNLAYDKAGNVQTLRRADETGAPIDRLRYDYSGNRLQSVTDSSGVALGWDATSATFGYDAAGNLTSQSGKIDDITEACPERSRRKHRNLPTRFDLANGMDVHAAYNAVGQRILKESSGGAWQFYVMDGSQTLAVIDQNGLSHMNLVGNATFGRIAANAGIIDTANARRYYLTDHLGSTRAVVDEAGNVLETFDYYPFGLLMPKRNTAGANTLVKFTGKELDDETGLFHFGARAYDAALGKWLSVDPLADKYPGISPYVYAANNPLLILDPDGRDIKIYYDCNDKGEDCEDWTFTGNNADEGRQLENELINQFLDAYTYITDNVEGTDLQKAAESRDHVFGLREGKVGNKGEATNYFDKYAGREYKGTIYWNPLRATEYESGTVGPPALGLAHEFGHAMEWARYAIGRTASEREQYATFVEEQKVARGLRLIGPNQVTRNLHSDGDAIIVRSPVSTTLDRKATYNYYLRLNAAGRNVKQYLKKYGNGN